MKKLLTLTGIGSIGAVLALLAACQTTAYNRRCRPERGLTLTQSGFKVITVTTPHAATGSGRLTQGRVSAVTSQREDVLRVSHWHERQDLRRETSPIQQPINTALADARMPATQRPRRRLQQGQGQMAGQSLMPTLETAGPNHIEVQQFGGFGPMGVNALGDW